MEAAERWNGIVTFEHPKDGCGISLASLELATCTTADGDEMRQSIPLPLLIIGGVL